MAGQCLKITILSWSGCQVLLQIRDGGEVRRQSEKAINLANVYQNGKRQTGAVLISSFLPSIGGQGSGKEHFNSQGEVQDSLRQAILYDYNNKSNEKQVKETVPTWSRNWLLLCNKSRVVLDQNCPPVPCRSKLKCFLHELYSSSPLFSRDSSKYSSPELMMKMDTKVVTMTKKSRIKHVCSCAH